jgi:hypothetical protein
MIKPKQINNNLASINTDEILDSFTKNQDKNEIVEVLNQLFKIENIDMITELSTDAVSLITAIETIAEYKDIPMWNFAVGKYKTLMVSKNRKSRKELIEAIKTQNHERNASDKLRDVFNRG